MSKDNKQKEVLTQSIHYHAACIQKQNRVKSQRVKVRFNLLLKGVLGVREIGGDLYNFGLATDKDFFYCLTFCLTNKPHTTEEAKEQRRNKGLGRGSEGVQPL